jgi:hypothetical protein
MNPISAGTFLFARLLLLKKVFIMNRNDDMKQQLDIINNNISRSYYSLVDAFSQLSARVKNLEKKVTLLEAENKRLKSDNDNNMNFSLN